MEFDQGASSRVYRPDIDGRMGRNWTAALRSTSCKRKKVINLGRHSRMNTLEQTALESTVRSQFRAPGVGGAAIQPSKLF